MGDIPYHIRIYLIGWDLMILDPDLVPGEVKRKKKKSKRFASLL